MIIFRNYLSNLPEKPSENTIKNYVADVSHFHTWIEKVLGYSFEPKNITAAHLGKFKDFLQASGFAPTTIERHISSLKKYFQFLTRYGFSQNPFDKLEENASKHDDLYGLKAFKNALYSRGLESNTMKNYMADVSHFFDWLEKTHEDYEVSQEAKTRRITSDTISEYKKRLLTILHLSPISVNRKLSSLRQYCQWATENGILKTNPFSEFQISNVTFQDDHGNAQNPIHPDVIIENSEPIEYSKFPPFRLLQKIVRPIDHLFLTAAIAPLHTFLANMQTIRTNQPGKYVKTTASGNVHRDFYRRYKNPKKLATILFIFMLFAIVSGVLAYLRFFQPATKPQEATHEMQTTDIEKDFVFSGRLTDSDGNTITTQTGVVFTFYDHPETFDIVLYQELVDVVPDEYGFFTIVLADVPEGLLISDTPVYLGIAVRGDAEMRPRQLISGKEERLISLFNAQGQLSIANDSPSLISQSGSFTIVGEKLLIRTKEASDGSIVLWPDGSGKVDVLAPLTNSLTGVVETADALSVKAASGIATPLSVHVGTANVFTIGADGALTAKGGADFAGSLTPAKNSTYDIGTSALHWKTIYVDNVIGPTTGTQGFWQRNSGTLSPTNITDDLLIGAIATSSAKFRVNAGNGNISSSGTITSSGNITSSGDVAVNGGDITSTGALTITPGAGYNLNVALTTTGDFSINTGQLHVDTSTGNVGIGTSAPSALFAVGTTFAVTAGNNVGIGTTSPAFKLDVAGGGRFTCSADFSNSGGFTSCSDIAEVYETTEEVEYGDLLRITGANTVGKTTKTRDAIIGVYSTSPGILVGGETLLGIQKDTLQQGKVPVALAGRAPTKVSMENGPIAPGDYLTSSSIPGVAMKATEEGPVLGRALEAFSENSEDQQASESKSQTNRNSDSSGVPSTSESFRTGKILVFINVSWYDPDVFLSDTGDYLIVKNATYSGLLNLASKGETFRGYFFDNLQAGLTEAKEITADRLTIATDEITIAGQSLKDYIVQIVKDTLASEMGSLPKIKSPLAEIDLVRTDILSPLASDTIIIDGNVSISKAVNAEKVTANDLLANRARIEDATISGRLEAGEIVSDSINTLQTQIASLSALTEIFKDGKLQASDSASLRLNKIFATSGAFLESFISLGPAGFSDITVAGILSLGSQFILHENQINVLGGDLQLQSVAGGGVSFVDRKVYIDSTGNMKIAGDLAVEGALTTNVIRPIPNQDLIFRLASNQESGNSSFIIYNSSDSAVLRITDFGDLIASGGAQFKDLTIEKLTLPQIIEKVSADGNVQKDNGSVGKGTITSGSLEVTIETPMVTENSLIYLSPTSPSEGHIPFLARQVANESFTVAIQHTVTNDVSFNWWIIN